MSEHHKDVPVSVVALLYVAFLWTLLIVAAMCLKVEHKRSAKTVLYHGCYVWSDGHATCEEPHGH